MHAFGQGEAVAMTGEQAVDIANSSVISTEPKLTVVSQESLSLGDIVEVMPIDYGFQPTKGELLVSSMEEIVVKRSDQRAGQVAVHFPRLGFQVSKAP